MDGKDQRWMPKVGGKYYIITEHKHVGYRGVRKMIWQGSELDLAYYKKGNCFKSKREAEFTFKMFGEAW